MHQTGEGNLPFNNVPEGTKEVNIFHDIDSPLLSGGKLIKEGKYTLVFGRKNAHVVKGQTGEVVKAIMKQAKEKNSDDVVITVPFNKKNTNMEDQFNWTSQTIIQYCQQCPSNTIKRDTVRLSTSSSRLDSEENVVTSNHRRILH